MTSSVRASAVAFPEYVVLAFAFDTNFLHRATAIPVTAK